MGLIINPFGNFGNEWTPNSLATRPSIWFNDSSAVTDAGSGACSQWNDIGTGGVNAIQGTNSNRPLIVAGDLNGRRIIRGDGTNDSMTIAQTNYMNAAASVWCFAVFKRTALDGASVSRFLFHVQTASNNVARFGFFAGLSTAGNDGWGIGVRRLDADAAAILAASPLTDTNYHMFLATMDYTNRTGTLYLDGTQTNQNTTLTTAGSCSASNSFGNLRLFSDGIPGAWANISLAEMASGLALPSATEIDKLFGYAAHRWGLTGNLPGGHPYTTNPPTT